MCIYIYVRIYIYIIIITSKIRFADKVMKCMDFWNGRWWMVIPLSIGSMMANIRISNFIVG